MPTYHILKNLAAVLDFDIYNIENMDINSIKQPNKFFSKSLNILNSARNEIEQKYYLEILQLAQKDLKLGDNKSV